MTKAPARSDSPPLRERALAAAVRLFSRHGYEGTSLQAIADELGVSKQALLYHFASKEGLRGAALQQMVELWRNVLPRLLSALTRPEAPFDEALGEVMTLFRAEPAYLRFLLQELLQGTGARHPMVADVEPWLALAADFIRRAQGEGRVDPTVDPEAWLINAATLILATLALLDGPRGGPAPDRVVREMARMIGSSLVVPR
jgi:TetR/AcrR family transcriptional regulator